MSKTKNVVVEKSFVEKVMDKMDKAQDKLVSEMTKVVSKNGKKN
jgi:hypothetical protein